MYICTMNSMYDSLIPDRFSAISGGGDTGVLREVDVIEDTTLGNVTKVVLFNDNIHTFDEVVMQLCKATGCNEGEADEKANEVHTRGKAIVFEGDLNDCLKVTSVLEEIALHTQIEF